MFHPATPVCSQLRKSSEPTRYEPSRGANRAFQRDAQLQPPVVFMAGVESATGETLEQALCAAGWQVRWMLSSDARLPRENTFVAPSCLVVDVTDPRLSQMLLQDRPEMAVVCITDEATVAITVLAMKAGALDVLAKPILAEALVRAVGNALEYSAARLSHDREAYALRLRYALLTPRERQVMALVVSGRLNKQIGGELGISEITVKAHRGRVMRKMEVRTLVGLVKAAAKIEASATRFEKEGARRPENATGQTPGDRKASGWSGCFARIAASTETHTGAKIDDSISRLRLVV